MSPATRYPPTVTCHPLPATHYPTPKTQNPKHKTPTPKHKHLPPPPPPFFSLLNLTLIPSPFSLIPFPFLPLPLPSTHYSSPITHHPLLVTQGKDLPVLMLHSFCITIQHRIQNHLLAFIFGGSIWIVFQLYRI